MTSPWRTPDSSCCHTSESIPGIFGCLDDITRKERKPRTGYFLQYRPDPIHRRFSDSWHEKPGVATVAGSSCYRKHAILSCGCSDNVIKREISYLFVGGRNCINVSSIDVTTKDLTIFTRICTGRRSLCNILTEKSVCLTNIRKSMSAIKLNVTLNAFQVIP